MVTGFIKSQEKNRRSSNGITFSRSSRNFFHIYKWIFFAISTFVITEKVDSVKRKSDIKFWAAGGDST